MLTRFEQLNFDPIKLPNSASHPKNAGGVTYALHMRYEDFHYR